MKKLALVFASALAATQVMAGEVEWKSDAATLYQVSNVYEACPAEFAAVTQSGLTLLSLTGVSGHVDGKQSYTFTLKAGYPAPGWYPRPPTVKKVLTVTKVQKDGPLASDAPALYDVKCDAKDTDEAL